MEYSVTIHTATGILTRTAAAGTLLSALLTEAVPGFAQPCAGNHTCGKCRVRVTGAVSDCTAEENALPSDADRTAGVRLACCCRVAGSCTVFCEEAGASEILTQTPLPAFDPTEAGVGLAVDIGTTTVVVRLLSRSDGQILAERAEANAQAAWGADVISRIDACRTQGLDTLQRAITEQLERMAQECLREAGCTAPAEAVVTGNTTMLHLFEGIDPAPLAVAPFAVPDFFGRMSRHTLAGAPVYLPRCIGPYIGADIVCALLAAGIHPEDGQTRLLADIGTNGELVLAHNGALVCCSTAAGPAFEGAGLSCGMPARTGAICAVSRADNGTLRLRTIQDAPAVGLCGSGALDAVRLLLEEGTLEDSGFLEEPFVLTPEVSLNQRDIRALQPAKAAICAGILTLLETAGIEAEEIVRFDIAGGFGATLNRTSAAEIGLFPAALTEKSVFLGNGALGGASMLLCARPLRAASEQLAQDAEELSLSASPVFSDCYIDCMSFEPF